VADDHTARRFFVVLLSGTVLLLAVVVRPLATALFMAAVLAGVTEPLRSQDDQTRRGDQNALFM
jgi:predicted PurR-regulated permease PerM